MLLHGVWKIHANWCSFQVAVARQLCKSIDIYDQDFHVRSLRT